jgi:hypothetical protein
LELAINKEELMKKNNRRKINSAILLLIAIMTTPVGAPFVGVQTTKQLKEGLSEYWTETL